jgi:hypothetical protein
MLEIVSKLRDFKTKGVKDESFSCPACSNVGGFTITKDGITFFLCNGCWTLSYELVE